MPALDVHAWIKFLSSIDWALFVETDITFLHPLWTTCPTKSHSFNSDSLMLESANCIYALIRNVIIELSGSVSALDLATRVLSASTYVAPSVAFEIGAAFLFKPVYMAWLIVSAFNPATRGTTNQSKYNTKSYKL